MLVVMSLVALIRFAVGHAPATAGGAKLSWFNPLHIGSFSTFVDAILLMLFIYWGWDSAVSVNEETKDSTKTPGRAAVISTVLLVAIYMLVTHRRPRSTPVSARRASVSATPTTPVTCSRCWARPSSAAPGSGAFSPTC